MHISNLRRKLGPRPRRRADQDDPRRRLHLRAAAGPTVIACVASPHHLPELLAGLRAADRVRSRCCRTAVPPSASSTSSTSTAACCSVWPSGSGPASCTEVAAAIEAETRVETRRYSRQRAPPSAARPALMSPRSGRGSTARPATRAAWRWPPPRAPAARPSPSPGRRCRLCRRGRPAALSVARGAAGDSRLRRRLLRPGPLPGPSAAAGARRHLSAGGRRPAGPRRRRSVGARRDEIGDLVRDFDAMAARLEALVHSQTQMLSDISHELRSPLARLNVALALARRKAGPGAEVDLDRIETEAERMNDLIGRLLALARAEATGACVGHARRPRRRGGHGRGRRPLRGAAPTQDRPARRWPGQWSWPVTRGCSTAPSTTSSATPCVTRRRLGDRHLVARDGAHAVGARPRSRARRAGRRAGAHLHAVPPRRPRPRTADGGGVGLGLAIARRAVTVHGGTITAENAADGGLLVTIPVPTATPHGLHRSLTLLYAIPTSPDGHRALASVQ